jgi:hypothetical protein
VKKVKSDPYPRYRSNLCTTSLPLPQPRLCCTASRESTHRRWYGRILYTPTLPTSKFSLPRGNVSRSKYIEHRTSTLTSTGPVIC